MVTDGQRPVPDASGDHRQLHHEATCLGYEPLSYKVTVSASIGALSLRLKESSLQLNTVTVTAQRGRRHQLLVDDRPSGDGPPASHLRQGREQLLPGVLTANPELTNSTRISSASVICLIR